MEQDKTASFSGTLISLGIAFFLLIVFAIIFKITMMTKEEKYKRSCTQGAATAILDAGAAYPEDVAAGPSPKPKLYGTLPIFNPEVKPKNKFMEKTRDFCADVYFEEQHNSSVVGSMAATAVGSHNISAAQLVIEHIDKGWGMGTDTATQRKIVAGAVADWGTHGHDQAVQDVLAKYDEALNDGFASSVTARVLGEGDFSTKDFCAHENTIKRLKLVKDPAGFLKKLGCDKLR